MDLNKNEKKYINTIENKLNIKVNEIEKINKGTMSKVFKINGKYILKIADPIFIKRELIYFNKNRCTFNEKLIYFDYKYRFVIYNVIEGNDFKDSTKANVEKNIDILINITKNYKSTYRKNFGYIYESYNSWYEFLKSEIEFNDVYLPKKFKEKNENFVDKAIERIKLQKILPKYIHGDLGVHNIIFDGELIKGIIDPTTVVGDYRYDIIYFIFSSSKIAKNVDYNKLINLLGKDIVDLMIILLYSRISKLYKYNSYDVEKTYFKMLWDKFKEE